MTADHTPPSVDLSKEALDALVARLRATTIEQDTEGEKYAVPQCLAGPGAADAITALRSQIATERALADKAIAAEQARATAAEAEVNDLRTKYEILDGGYRALVSRCKKEVARAEKAEAERDAAMAGAVRVKPLNWETANSDDGYDFFSASPSGPRYGIKSVPGGQYKFTSGLPITPPFKGLEAAKAAAQADYERRILAALEPDPAAQDALVAAKHPCLSRAIPGKISHRTSVYSDGRQHYCERCGEKLSHDNFSNIPADYVVTHDAGNYHTPQHQTDALAAVRREARVDGMRKAAEIAASEWKALGGAADAIAAAILAAAEKEAGHD